MEDKIKEKILYKHKVKADEIKELFLSKPLILKSRENRYIAIGHNLRFLTIIFEVVGETAFIITAYPSSEAQRKLYKLKKK